MILRVSLGRLVKCISTTLLWVAFACIATTPLLVSADSSSRKYTQQPPGSTPSTSGNAASQGPPPSENVLGKEPWCGPLVRGLTTTIAEGKHIRFCWRDDPAAVMRTLQVDRASVEQITQIMENLNMKPRPFSMPSLGHVQLRVFPPSRELPGGAMFPARVDVYPDDDLDTLVDDVREEYLLPPANLVQFRDEVKALFDRRGMTPRDASSGIYIMPLLSTRADGSVDLSSIPYPPIFPSDSFTKPIPVASATADSSSSSSSTPHVFYLRRHPSANQYHLQLDLSSQRDELLTPEGKARKQSSNPVITVVLLPQYTVTDLTEQLQHFFKPNPALVSTLLDHYKRTGLPHSDSTELLTFRVAVDPRELPRRYVSHRAARIARVKELSQQGKGKGKGGERVERELMMSEKAAAAHKQQLQRLRDILSSSSSGSAPGRDRAANVDVDVDVDVVLSTRLPEEDPTDPVHVVSTFNPFEAPLSPEALQTKTSLAASADVAQMDRVIVTIAAGEDVELLVKRIGRLLLLSSNQRRHLRQHIFDLVSLVGLTWTPPSPRPSFVWLRELKEREWRLTSQNGEDGVIDWIFANIGTTNRYYVEFGAEKGTECNTQYLREHRGWTGLLMDGGNRNAQFNLRQEFVHPWNVNHLFKKYQVPKEFDLLSIDLDFADYFVWKTLSSQYRPRVVILEVNAAVPWSSNQVVDPIDPLGWKRDDHYGCSLKAAAALGKLKGYTLVYHESRGVNAFFIRDDILTPEGIATVPPLAKLARAVNHYNGRSSIHTRFNTPGSATRKWIYNDLPYAEK